MSELWLGLCSEIAKVTGRGWRVRIWGRGGAIVSGRCAVGVGLGSVGGMCGKAGEIGVAGMCVVISE